MALIINLETSTRICSVALASDEKILGLKESGEDKSHAVKLTVFINDLLREQSFEASDLDAIAVSKGPGSYTGLRIGVSTAKGLAYALDKPLIGVDTLAALSGGASRFPEIIKLIQSAKQVLLCPMLDARRMEVYTALFKPNGEVVDPVSAKIIDEDSYGKYLDQHLIVFFGDGAVKCEPYIRHPNARLVDGIECSASYMASQSDKAFRQGQFENVAYFEPYYLKDFIPTIPKKKVIP